MIRSACRAVVWGTFALLLWLTSMGSAQAAPFSLRVRPLHDAGGLIAHELPGRLTTALNRFLHDHADPTLQVETTERFDQSTARKATVHYTLEGDLSYASGANEESGRYLLVARLLRDGRSPALIGQWAGTSSSLRYLTANLRNDPRVHTLGLIGEIGSRVLATLASDAARPDRRWRALYSRLLPLRSSEAAIVQPEAPYSPRTGITGGDTFRLRLQAGAFQRCYLLTVGENNRLDALSLTMTQKDALAVSQAIPLSKGTREAWLLCQPHPTDVRRQQLCPYHLEEDDAPVHVVNGVGNSAPAHQEIAALLLAEVEHDSGMWHVLGLRVTAARK